MRIAVINYSARSGRPVASHLLAPRMTNAEIYVDETVNETSAPPAVRSR